MVPSSFKTKGFTLIELMLVIVLIALLSITALTSMMRSQDQFRFKSVVNETANTLRTIRNYALSNKPAPIEAAPKYGAVITAGATTNTITIFGDTDGDNQYDPDESTEAFPDTEYDHLFKTYTIPEKSGTYELYNGDESDPLLTTQTLTIFYQPTTANFSIIEPAFNKRYAVLKIIDSVDLNRFGYIVLFKESGNPEVLNNLSVLQQ